MSVAVDPGPIDLFVGRNLPAAGGHVERVRADGHLFELLSGQEKRKERCRASRRRSPGPPKIGGKPGATHTTESRGNMQMVSLLRDRKQNMGRHVPRTRRVTAIPGYAEAAAAFLAASAV
jgi:hypothetical protein